jgi:hypothetical protein
MITGKTISYFGNCNDECADRMAYHDRKCSQEQAQRVIAWAALQLTNKPSDFELENDTIVQSIEDVARNDKDTLAALIKWAAQYI